MGLPIRPRPISPTFGFIHSSAEDIPFHYTRPRRDARKLFAGSLLFDRMRDCGGSVTAASLRSARIGRRIAVGFGDSDYVIVGNFNAQSLVSAGLREAFLYRYGFPVVRYQGADRSEER